METLNKVSERISSDISCNISVDELLDIRSELSIEPDTEENKISIGIIDGLLALKSLVIIIMVLFFMSCEKVEVAEKSSSIETEIPDTMKVSIEIVCSDSIIVTRYPQYQLPGHTMEPTSYKRFKGLIMSATILMDRDYRFEVKSVNPKSSITVGYYKYNPKRLEVAHSEYLQITYLTITKVGEVIVKGRFTSDNSYFKSN